MDILTSLLMQIEKIQDTAIYQSYFIHMPEDLRNPYLLFVYLLILAYIVFRCIRRIVLSIVIRVKKSKGRDEDDEDI